MRYQDTETRAVATRERLAAWIDFLRVVGPGAPCLPWPWARQSGRYARVSSSLGTTYAHRWVWEQINGPIPEGYEVCHNCPEGDNPSCCRPSHLWVGSHSANIRDAYAKGRMHGNTGNHALGEQHHSARLTIADVIEIRRRAKTEVQRHLAREFGVSAMTINAIVKRRIWRHIPEIDD